MWFLSIRQTQKAIIFSFLSHFHSTTSINSYLCLEFTCAICEWLSILHFSSMIFHASHGSILSIVNLKFLTIFFKFKPLMENQFSTTIKLIQSDGGGEYNFLHFQSFLNKHGIIHCKTCPHTSQQNGLVERKLRHILETSLTLLTHSHLSNRYWVDAFLSAVYIINRLPTPILDNTSPFFTLYKKEPDYTILRVFGCKCYPLLCPYSRHKLNFRSKPCIFLVYHHAS